MNEIKKHLVFLYGEQVGSKLVFEVETLLQSYVGRIKNVERAEELYSEKDAMLITYGDQFYEKGSTPLSTLNKFVNEELGDCISAVHILPFYPSSSDGGFSVIDYKEVCSEIGTWNDIEYFSKDLMFDAVFNHISVKSEWFNQWKNGNEEYRDFFIAKSKDELDELASDVSKVTRPRATPLFCPVKTCDGDKYVWATFSADQIDLNFDNPKVLLKMLDVLLFYFEKKSRYTRIDAVPFFWKEFGTNCVHLPKTHELVKLFRAIGEKAAPGSIIITESNVPHKENISYMGDGTDEAHMVYNFTLAPLILHANFIGSAKYLQEWSGSLKPLAETNTFFNFTATHDGVGLRPLEGILGKDDIDLICKKTVEGGGAVNMKSNPDGSKSPYEINITWSSSLMDGALDLDQQVTRIVSSHLAMCSFPGIPGIYVHSFLGSRNWDEGVKKTKHNRDINRQRFEYAEIMKKLNQNDFEGMVFSRLKKALTIRTCQKSFHPLSRKRDLCIDDTVWSFVREMRDGSEKILVLYNLSSKMVPVEVKSHDTGLGGDIYDLISGTEFSFEGDVAKIECRPFEIMWLKEK